MSTIKGQNLRIFLGGKVIALGTSCTVHIAANLEDTSTKDDTGDWSEQECTGKSWDISADALVGVGSTSDTTGLYAFDVAALIGTKVVVDFAQTTGTDNRTTDANAKHLSGYAIINDISIQAPNKANATYSIQATGVGELKASAPTSSSEA